MNDATVSPGTQAGDLALWLAPPPCTPCPVPPKSCCAFTPLPLLALHGLAQDGKDESAQVACGTDTPRRVPTGLRLSRSTDEVDGRWGCRGTCRKQWRPVGGVERGVCAAGAMLPKAVRRARVGGLGHVVPACGTCGLSTVCTLGSQGLLGRKSLFVPPDLALELER